MIYAKKLFTLLRRNDYLIAICIAENLDDARNAWRKEFKKWMKTDCFGPYETEIMNDPIVYDLEIPCDAICHFVTGGG